MLQQRHAALRKRYKHSLSPLLPILMTAIAAAVTLAEPLPETPKYPYR